MFVEESVETIFSTFVPGSYRMTEGTKSVGEHGLYHRFVSSSASILLQDGMRPESEPALYKEWLGYR